MTGLVRIVLPKGTYRAYRMTTVYNATPRAGGGYVFGQSNQWVFNSIVLFGNYSR